MFLTVLLNCEIFKDQIGSFFKESCMQYTVACLRELTPGSGGGMLTWEAPETPKERVRFMAAEQGLVK